MMILLLSLVTLVVAVPNPDRIDSAGECVLKGDLAIILDSSVDAESFELLKEAAMDAALSFDLSNSRVGIWKTSEPPRMELALGPTSREDLIRTFEEIAHDYSSSQTEEAAEALKEAAQSLGSAEQEGKDKAILYVAGSPKDESLLQAAEEVRQAGVVIRAIAVGMNERDAEDLFAVAGGDAGVLQLARDSVGSSKEVKEFVCTKGAGFTQDFCFGVCWG